MSLKVALWYHKFIFIFAFEKTLLDFFLIFCLKCVDSIMMNAVNIFEVNCNGKKLEMAYI